MMNITAHSKNRLIATFRKWDVPKEFADPMYNYLVYGYNPGSCFTAVLANDFMRAIQSSHSANTVEAFKALVGWIREHCPQQAKGSYGQVQRWSELNESERRSVLEYCGLIYSEKEEVLLILREEHTEEPVLY